MKKDNLTRLTKTLLDVMFYAGILVTLTLPITVRFAMEWISKRVADAPLVYLNWGIGQYYTATVVIYFFLGLSALALIRELRKMFRTVLNQEAFVMDNVKSLHRMAKVSLLIVILSIVRSAVYMTIAMLVVILVFVIAGLFSEVLSRVFEEAINYKEENDLTI